MWCLAVYRIRSIVLFVEVKFRVSGFDSWLEAAEITMIYPKEGLSAALALLTLLIY